jgi:glutamine amidotransferase
MCRLLSYLGTPIALEKLLYQPEHSLIVQSYQPKEMTSGVVNADGFGMGWYHRDRETAPFSYKTTLPVWNDINLPHLSRYIESGCMLATVRSATAGQSVDLVNCQPFQQGDLTFIHNGFISDFRKVFYRLLRERLSNSTYPLVQGNTDSEHIFGLLLDQIEKGRSLSDAVQYTIAILQEMADFCQVEFAANLVVSDGKQIVASRFANRDPVPTLYWLEPSDTYPDAILIASEPIIEGRWQPFGDRSLLTVGSDLSTCLIPLS